MTALVTIVPSRGRPQAAREMVTTFQQTCTAATRLVFAVDRDDPTLEEYITLLQPDQVDVYIAPAPSNMVRTLNAAALQYAPTAYALGFMGDDHRPRTVGWDAQYLRVLRELRTGIVYGNDLLQGEAIPTQVAMTSDIVKTLRHMAPPVLTHLFVDNYWRDLGRASGCIRYVPEVVVEHMHPFAGKADMDDGYARVNDAAMYSADGTRYAGYISGPMFADIAKVKALRDA